MPHAIVVDDLHLSWPDGATLFDGLSFTVGPGRTALIGVNGSIRVAGSLGYLRQDLSLDADLSVDEVLGIARARWALWAIEGGAACSCSTSRPTTSTWTPAAGWTTPSRPGRG
jgi:hypothetical protein